MRMLSTLSRWRHSGDVGCNKQMSTGEVTSTNNPIIIPVKPAISIYSPSRLLGLLSPGNIMITHPNTELKAGGRRTCSLPRLWSCPQSFTYFLYSALWSCPQLFTCPNSECTNLVLYIYPMMHSGFYFHQIQPILLVTFNTCRLVYATDMILRIFSKFPTLLVP